MDCLTAISSIDGRYYNKIKELSDTFSEFGYQKYRLFVEIEYLVFFSQKQIFDVKPSDIQHLKNIYIDFSIENAIRIKEIEKKTNHDVKAIEYFIRDEVKRLNVDFNHEFIHFGLTSQDINSVANLLRLQDTMTKIMIPNLSEIIKQIKTKADDYIKIPMLSRTHGQSASPTLLGKEFLVFYERLINQFTLLQEIKYKTKFGGAIGNLNAHYFCDDKKPWIELFNEFMNYLGIDRHQYTTQIDHYDNFSEIFDVLARICNILIDFSRDIWQYISYGYFNQIINKDETGSSTMPHKVNPIDFENGEGNLFIAQNYFQFLSRKLPISRLQRDLTDSTITRNIGVPIGHMLIGIKSILKGLNKLLVNTSKISEDLSENSVVIAEAIQSQLRYLGIKDSYEKIKDVTRNNNNSIDLCEVEILIRKENLSKQYKDKIMNLSPFNYLGKVTEL